MHVFVASPLFEDMGGGKKKKQSQGRGGGQKGQPQKATKSKGGAEAAAGDLPDPMEGLVEDAEQLDIDQEMEEVESAVQDPDLSTKDSKGLYHCSSHDGNREFHTRASKYGGLYFSRFPR